MRMVSPAEDTTRMSFSPYIVSDGHREVECLTCGSRGNQEVLSGSGHQLCFIRALWFLAQCLPLSGSPRYHPYGEGIG